MKFFISHSKKDNDLAKSIVKLFQEYNIDYWVDFEQLEEGDELSRKINSSLQKSTHFLLFCTKNVIGIGLCIVCF
jgi:hypothetical protein